MSADLSSPRDPPLRSRPMTSILAIPARAAGRGVMLSALLLWVAGCGRVSSGPRLTADWVGSDTGRISAAATASWCPVAGRLEVIARRGDTGFGLVLYPVSDLAAGSYPAFDPGVDTVRRPGATAAVRWFTERQVFGFQSDSGSVELTRVDDRLQLRFGFRLRRLDGERTMIAVGRAMALVPDSCPADSVPNTAPTQ
jgi:hypothetical protein